MRGTVEDIILIGAFVLILGFSVMVSHLYLDAVENVTQFQENSNISTNIQQGKEAIVILGNSALFIVIMLGLASVVGAYYTETHPVFFVFSILLFGIGIFILTLFGDLFLTMAASDELILVANEFSVMIVTIQNLPVLGVLIGTLIILALYIKRDDIRASHGGNA